MTTEDLAKLLHDEVNRAMGHILGLDESQQLPFEATELPNQDAYRYVADRVRYELRKTGVRLPGPPAGKMALTDIRRFREPTPGIVSRRRVGREAQRRSN